MTRIRRVRVGRPAAPLANTGGNALSCNQQEVTWVKLADGSILTADPPVQPGANHSERYVPAQGKWVADTPLGFSLFNTEFGYNGDGETGPAFLLPKGNAIFIGGSALTGLYIPSAPQGVYKWTSGSLSPNGGPRRVRRRFRRTTRREP